MNFKLTQETVCDNPDFREEILRMTDTDENLQASVMTAGTRKITFYGKYIPALTIGGIGTEPQYRRSGCVRTMFNRLFEMAPERGWAVSMLNPFSSKYYEQFGYGIYCNRRMVKFDMNFISDIPRCRNLKPLNSEERLQDALKVFRKFALKRNGMFERTDGSNYSFDAGTDKTSTYIWYDEQGEPASYIKCRVCNHLVVNHMESDYLFVEELVFTTPESLKALFGFMRMYEGENDSVYIYNTAMCPEAEMLIGETVTVKCEELAGVYARILDVKKVFEAVQYPEDSGKFVVCIDDFLSYTKGNWKIDFTGGKGVCTKVSDSENYDIRAKMPALTSIVYGYREYTADIAAYMPGVEVRNKNSDFFRVFHKQCNGMFEHF